MKIILASGSPRRQELLKTITEDFLVVPSLKPELNDGSLSAEKLALALANDKCFDIKQSYREDCIIGCDTVVEAFGNILGKPKDQQDAFSMLSMLSGKPHNVYTGVCISTPTDTKSFVSKTKVYFEAMSTDEIERYIETKEPFDKAGGYGIQGAAAKFISKINGDYYNVMGFPISEIYKTLKGIGVVK